MAEAVFYIALVLIALMLLAGCFGVSIVRHEAIAETVAKQEEKIREIARDGKKLAKKIRFENAHRLIVRSTDFAKHKLVALKRRFDSRQPKFFLAAQKPGETHKNSVSFFLRHVTEHKNSLKK
ncbi:MAG: hypothetical protein KGH93_02940 [Patescibacteria group bacterium]|nr:hypothetical protein [Patescibacteria group bacterium]MDE1946127.1 hypothetical protein [Patescibacteria group bacterium]